MNTLSGGVLFLIIGRIYFSILPGLLMKLAYDGNCSTKYSFILQQYLRVRFFYMLMLLLFIAIMIHYCSVSALSILGGLGLACIWTAVSNFGSWHGF